MSDKVRPEDVEVSLVRYHARHGSSSTPFNLRPGHWGFEINGEEVFIFTEHEGEKTFTLEYGEAEGEAKRRAAALGVRRIALLP